MAVGREAGSGTAEQRHSIFRSFLCCLCLTSRQPCWDGTSYCVCSVHGERTGKVRCVTQWSSTRMAVWGPEIDPQNHKERRTWRREEELAKKAKHFLIRTDSLTEVKTTLFFIEYIFKKKKIRDQAHQNEHKQHRNVNGQYENVYSYSWFLKSAK